MAGIPRVVSELRAIHRVCGLRATTSYLRALIASLGEVSRSRTLVPVDRRMAGRRWRFTLQGVTVELDGTLFSGAREMYCRQVYFPSGAFALTPGTAVVDLGANVGLFSLLAALVGCEVLAVEAQRGFVREISESAARHGVAARLVAEHARVGPGTGVFAEPGAPLLASHAEGTTAPAVPFEELLAKHRIDRVDFLKVDIEGSEFDLFRSAGSWLGRVRRIGMEVHPRFGSVTELRERIRSADMSVELRNNDLVVVEHLPESGGYLFAHKVDRPRP